MAFKIVRNDITKMNTEAIVNTANDQVTVGTGCDSAVYKAAGYEELLAYRTEKIGYVPEGEVFLTPGFGLQAKYIIHAVSPRYAGGNEGEEEKLRSCYRKSLRLAEEKRLHSIAFPLISTGSFGYPKEEGMRIAVDEINAFLLNHEMDIFLVVFDDQASSLGKRIYPDLDEYIDQNYVEDACWEEYEEEAYEPDSSRVEKRLLASLFHARKREKRAGNKLEEKLEEKAESKLEEKAESKPEEKPEGKREKKLAKEPLCEDAFMARMEESEAAKYEFFDFEELHESKLEERMKHISDTFSQYLMYLIREKKMENAEVYKRAIVDKKIFSKIKNNVDYHPQKLTALCLCVGAKLNLDESKDLLARAGYALSPCDKTDIIFSYFIENEIYDMIELDIQLEEHGLPCIIS